MKWIALTLASCALLVFFASSAPAGPEEEARTTFWDRAQQAQSWVAAEHWLKLGAFAETRQMPSTTKAGLLTDHYERMLATARTPEAASYFLRKLSTIK